VAKQSCLTFWISFGLVFLNIVALLGLHPVSARPLQAPLDTLPKVIGEWRGKNRFFSDKVTAILQANDSLLRFYARPDGDAVWLYVAFWGRQADGMAAHSPKLCYPGNGWLPTETGQETLLLPHGARKEIRVNRILFQKGNVKEMVLYWYQTGPRVVTSEYVGKFLLAYDSLWNRRSDVAFIRFSVEVTQGNTALAMERAREIVQRVVPLLDDILPS
jgi:EpsI family protein